MKGDREKLEVVVQMLESSYRLASEDRDILAEHFPDDQRQIGYYDGYSTCARDFLTALGRDVNLDKSRPTA